MVKPLRELLNIDEIESLVNGAAGAADPLTPAQRDALLQLFMPYTCSRDPVVAVAAKGLWDKILSGPLGARWHKEK